MKFSTALTISGFCLAALVAEALLAYLVYSNHAYTMAESGQYTNREAYTSGPMGLAGRIFYGSFAITAVIGIGAPLISLVSIILNRIFQRKKSADPPETRT